MQTDVIVRTGLLAAGLLLAAGTAAAHQQASRAPAADAQPEPVRDAAAIEAIDAAIEALGELQSLSFSVNRSMVITDELSPENAMFATVRLGSRGEIKAARNTDGEWTYRVEGYADNIGQKDAFQIAIHREPNVLSWLDYKDKMMIVSRPTLARGAFVASADDFGPRYFFDKAPYKAELDAPVLRSLGADEVDGVLCEVVEVEYGPRSKNMPLRVYFSTSDRLPRLIVRVMVQGFEEHMKITDLDRETEIDRDLITLVAPSGWKTEYRPATLDPSYQRDSVTSLPPANTAGNRTAGVGGAVGNQIPSFTSATLLGDEITSQSLLGKPAVLVFWTSWIPDAVATISDMAAIREQYGDSASLVAFTVRERSPDAAFNLMVEAGLEDVTLVTEGREAIVGMDVLRAPAFIVTDADGVIAYRSESYEAEQTLSEVKATLDGLATKDGE